MSAREYEIEHGAAKFYQRALREYIRDGGYKPGVEDSITKRMMDLYLLELLERHVAGEELDEDELQLLQPAEVLV